MTLGHLSLRDDAGAGFWMKRNQIGLGEVLGPRRFRAGRLGRQADRRQRRTSFRMADPFGDFPQARRCQRRGALAPAPRQYLFRHHRAAAAVYARRRLFRRGAAPRGRRGAARTKRVKARRWRDRSARTSRCFIANHGVTFCGTSDRARHLRRDFPGKGLQGAAGRRAPPTCGERCRTRRSRASGTADHDAGPLGAFLALFLPQARSARRSARRGRRCSADAARMSVERTRVKRFIGKPLRRREDVALSCAARAVTSTTWRCLAQRGAHSCAARTRTRGYASYRPRCGQRSARRAADADRRGLEARRPRRTDHRASDAVRRRPADERCAASGLCQRQGAPRRRHRRGGGGREPVCRRRWPPKPSRSITRCCRRSATCARPSKPARRSCTNGSAPIWCSRSSAATGEKTEAAMAVAAKVVELQTAQQPARGQSARAARLSVRLRRGGGPLHALCHDAAAALSAPLAVGLHAAYSRAQNSRDLARCRRRLRRQRQFRRRGVDGRVGGATACAGRSNGRRRAARRSCPTRRRAITTATRAWASTAKAASSPCRSIRLRRSAAI